MRELAVRFAPFLMQIKVIFLFLMNNLSNLFVSLHCVPKEA